MSDPGSTSPGEHVLAGTWPVVVGVLLSMLGLTIVSPILPLYAREFDVSRTAAGLVLAGSAISRFVVDTVGSFFIDRLETKRAMHFAAGLLIVSSIAAALAPTFTFLLASRVLEGAGSALYAILGQTWLLRRTPRHAIGRAMARYQAGLLIGLIVGPIIGGVAASVGNLRAPFYLYSLVGVVMIYVTTRLPNDAPNVRGDAPEARRRTVRHRTAFIGILFVSFAIFVSRVGGWGTLIPLYASEELRLSVFDIAVVLSVPSLLNLTLVRYAGITSDRRRRGWVAASSLLITSGCLAAFSLASGIAGLMLISGIYGAGASFASVAAPAMAADLATPGNEGRAISRFRAAGDAGGIVGPIAVGAFADTSFAAAFLFASMLMLLAAFVAAAQPDGLDEERTRPAGT